MFISGVKVSFPDGKKPFPQQIGVMQKIIGSATQSQNALLESPTGTGKTLALLCSTLSWQKKQYETDCQLYLASVEAAAIANSQPLPAPPLNEKKRSRYFDSQDDAFEEESLRAGFIPAITAPVVATQTPEPQPVLPTVPPKPIKIFYSSRTHTQLSQVVSELKRCPPELLSGPSGGGGGLKITVLGSREQYCVNPKVYKEKASVNKNDACSNLVKENKCPYFTSANVLAKQIGNQIMDLEDLVALGKKDLSCPFYASKRSMSEAHIVFLPYNYLMDPSIRSSSKLAEEIRGSIVIFDEAHNIEDVSRDAASIEMSLETIKSLTYQLGQIGSEVLELSKACEEISRLIQGLAGWAHGRPAATSDNGLAADNRVVLEGPEAIASIEQQEGISITPQTLAEYRAHLQLLKSKDDKDEDLQQAPQGGGKKRGSSSAATLSNGTVGQIESLLYCLEFLVADGFRYARDFRIATITKWKPGGGGGRQQLAYRNGGQHELFLCIWCLNPAVAFRALAETTRSLILTSGTLSPLRAFAAELGVEFKHTLEANHVCDINKQLMALGVQRMHNELLDCTFKNAERLDFQSAVGEAIHCIAKVTPGGVLVFFPSYAMLERCTNRWKQTGMWDGMHACKPISVETKGSSEEFDRAVQDYRALCAQQTGGMFFAVFRGKLSEGIDFRDEQARAVVIIGIPFPNTRDLVVGLKKQHQDAAKRRAFGAAIQPLSGNEWYEQQAYRALNQALGRVIRHRNDYGAIVLLDHRFREPRVVDNLSKWMRGAVRATNELNETPAMIADFFQRLSLHPPGGGGAATVVPRVQQAPATPTPRVQQAPATPTPRVQQAPVTTSSYAATATTPAAPSPMPGKLPSFLPTSAALRAEKRDAAAAEDVVDLT